MTGYDRTFWEARWSEALREHGDRAARLPPNAHLVDGVAGLRPGLALDAGCGHGSDAVWLAARGWRVTAVDFSATALAYAKARAARTQIDWIEADLATWAPGPAAFDLVVSVYVHAPGSVEDLVRRLAGGVAPGGTLFLVGHRSIKPGQVQVSVEAASAALDRERWELLIAEERPPARAAGGVDAVVLARLSRSAR
jgi:SAM-dependent methyltransferase